MNILGLAGSLKSKLPFGGLGETGEFGKPKVGLAENAGLPLPHAKAIRKTRSANPAGYRGGGSIRNDQTVSRSFLASNRLFEEILKRNSALGWQLFGRLHTQITLDHFEGVWEKHCPFSTPSPDSSSSKRFLWNDDERCNQHLEDWSVCLRTHASFPLSATGLSFW